MYFEMAHFFWAQPSYGAGVNVFLESLTQNYNLFFAFPSLVSFSLFEPSRITFILTNFSILFIGTLIGYAALYRKVFAWTWDKALLTSAGIAAFIPFLWTPLLEGYPDHGAVALLTFAVALAVPQKQSLKTMLLIGVLLGASIVFRRHFAYPALAVILTIGLFDMPGFFKGGWIERRALTAKYMSLAVSLLAVIGLLEPVYFKNILSTDYMSLYKSYSHTASYFLTYVLAQMGLGLILIAGTGLLYAWKTAPAVRTALLKILTLIVAWLLMWSFGPAQAGHHYLISILPLFCFIGLGGFFNRSIEKKKHKLIISFLFTVLAINSLYSFWLAPHFVYPSDKPSPSLLSTPRIAWVRTDNSELRHLASFVSQSTSGQDKIVAVGSSFTFNQHLLHILLRGTPASKRLLFSPETDSSQQPPYISYAKGTVFIVASPTQYHLDPAKQKVISSLASLFPPPKELSSLFEKEEQSFLLDRNVRITIWRRIKPYPKALLDKALKHIAKSCTQE